MLANNNLFPESLKLHIRIFFFNKYLKKHKIEYYYKLDEKALPFYEDNFDVNILTHKLDDTLILQKEWDSIYQKTMNDVRDYIKANHDELLAKLNKDIFDEIWDKYAIGSYSAWEMQSVSFYYHEHELYNINNELHYITSFKDIPENPVISKVYHKGGKNIQIYELFRIAGTVLDKNKYRHTVSLLTTDGVVHVKCHRDQFAYFDKQLSEMQTDGKKKVIEKSWFSRGNKLLITGIRRGDMFIPKVYKNSVYQHAIYLITQIKDDGDITAIGNRVDVEIADIA